MPLFGELLGKLMAAVLLAIVAVHAAPSGALPFERAGGSAFDASTAEVAVATSRKAPAWTAAVPLGDPPLEALRLPVLHANSTEREALPPQCSFVAAPGSSARARPGQPRAPPRS
jgi:hypothetical protein